MAVRTIIFRGKRIDNGEWVEGAYMPYYYSTRYGKVAAIFTNDDVLCKTCCYPVDPSTVGQYTGLKDKNGKRIFEGDIVQAHFRTNHSKQIFRVTFDDGMFIFNNGYVKLPVRGIYGIKVIGNVHDNPKYMKEGAGNG